MVAATVSTEEFVELWRTHQSAQAIADAIGVTLRQVHERRRRLEKKLNVRLEAKAPNAASYKHLSPYEHKEHHHLGIENGDVIVFSDAHFWPQNRTTAYRGLLKLIRELKPKAVICGGDAFDGARISRFARPSFLEQGPTVIEELKACKQYLGEIEEAAGRAKLVWPLGNHDLRFEARLAANAPDYEGIQGFHLKDHFPAWIPCWCAWANDDTLISHRSRGGVHATYNNTLHAGVNMVTGHLHQLQVRRFTDFRGNRYGVDSGTLAEITGPQFSTYLEAKVPNWASGFVVLRYHQGRLLMPMLAQKWDRDHIEFQGRLVNVSSE